MYSNEDASSIMASLKRLLKTKSITFDKILRVIGLGEFSEIGKSIRNLEKFGVHEDFIKEIRKIRSNTTINGF